MTYKRPKLGHPYADPARGPLSVKLWICIHADTHKAILTKSKEQRRAPGVIAREILEGGTGTKTLDIQTNAE